MRVGDPECEREREYVRERERGDSEVSGERWVVNDEW